MYLLEDHLKGSGECYWAETIALRDSQIQFKRLTHHIFDTHTEAHVGQSYSHLHDVTIVVTCKLYRLQYQITSWCFKGLAWV